MANLELAENEANALIKLLDVAVKSQGLGVAQDAVILVAKIQKAFQPKAEEVKEAPVVEGEVVTSAKEIPSE